VVEAFVGACVLDSHHIADIFYHTNKLWIAFRIGANAAKFFRRDVMTISAIAKFLAEANQYFSKMFYVLCRCFQEM
jgi:hypothetical protein